MRHPFIAITLGACALLCTACHKNNQPEFNYTVDKFYDLEILRYQVPGYEDLTL